MKAQEILARIEEKKGRKLDLTDSRDKFRLFDTINREFQKLEGKLSMIDTILNTNYRLYDPSEKKTIALSDRDKYGV